MAELTEVATETVAQAAEGVAANAQQVASASRAFTSREGSILLGGIIIGAATATWITRRLLRDKLETKYSQIAEEEIDAMREHFRSRLVSKEEKPDLSGLAEKNEDLGYTTPIAPRPAANPRPDPAETATELDPPSHHEVAGRFGTKDPDEGWDYEEEKRNRTDASVPYVIHIDEREEAGFTEATFTYYDVDDVVCDEQDKIIDAVDEILGHRNLNKFGHGSPDPNVVYIRNDALGMEIELIRSPNSYAEEVRGIKHSEQGYETRRRRRRSSPDDE